MVEIDRLATCAIRGCNEESAFEVTGGDNYFDPAVICGACSFHRVEVMEIMFRAFPETNSRDR